MAKSPLSKVIFALKQLLLEQYTAAAGHCQRMNWPFLSACQVYTGNGLSPVNLACSGLCALVSLVGVDVQACLAFV